MNSGFGQQKWENLRRGIPIFHIILPVPSEPPLFRGLIRYSAPHWCTHPEEPEFHRFLYLFFQLFDPGFCFFSSFSSFRLRACSSFCCCQESLLSELSVSGALVSAGSDGAGAYFSVSSSFSQDNNRSHQYNSQSPDGSGQESL